MTFLSLCKEQTHIPDYHSHIVMCVIGDGLPEDELNDQEDAGQAWREDCPRPKLHVISWSCIPT